MVMAIKPLLPHNKEKSRSIVWAWTGGSHHKQRCTDQSIRAEASGVTWCTCPPRGSAGGGGAPACQAGEAGSHKLSLHKMQMHGSLPSLSRWRGHLFLLAPRSHFSSGKRFLVVLG